MLVNDDQLRASGGIRLASGRTPRRIMKKLCPVLAGLLLYLGPSVPSAWAESFRIQDGAFLGGGFRWDSGIPPDAFGGVGVASGEFTFGGTFDPVIVEPGQQFTLTNIGVGNLAGEVGVPSAGGHDVDVRGTADLRVTFGRLLAPAPFPGGGDDGFIFLTAAFSMSAVLDGTLLEQLEDSTLRPISTFRNEVFGQGRATVVLQPLFETRTYEVVSTFGTFDPVPEPGTIVLLGLGGVMLAALVARRRQVDFQ
jgi:hypothetical protein